MDSPLSDIRVLDLSTGVAGPFCARLLGDYGADVVKIEPPALDPGRDLPPIKDGAAGPNRSGFFAYLNTNKRGVIVDLVAEAGRDVVRRLAATADVVVESFEAGYLDGIGLGFDALERSRPGIILTSITPFGQTGPWRQRQANDLVHFALSGWASINGIGDGPPLKGSGWQASYLGGLSGFLGTLSALVYRDRHGVGQQVDVSELEALTEIFGPRFLGAQHSAADPRRGRNDFISGPVECKDGHFSLTLSRAYFWRDAMNVLGLPELAEDTNYWETWYRVAHRQELSEKVEPKIREWRKQQLFDRLSEIRVVSGMVLTTAEVFENPHLRERGFFVETEQPELDRLEMPGAPFQMRETPASYRRPAPRPGEHTEEVLTDLLSLTNGEVDDLRAAGAVR
jgi:crotonobetainyl-CoA:carnitine CoA-transferase CaiB-like acyl-CoA transferase